MSPKLPSTAESVAFELLTRPGARTFLFVLTVALFGLVANSHQGGYNCLEQSLDGNCDQG